MGNALAKLWIHGGARIDAGENASRGRADWEGSYLAQRRHKVEQLELITRYAGSRGCRMVHLVEHFGDQQDDGRRCGRCDMCAPLGTVAIRFRTPSAGERGTLGQMLETLRASDGQASGRLHRELFGARLARDRFERLITALVRSGHIGERAESFEKDGRVIEFRRLFLTALGRGATDLGSVPVAGEPETGARQGWVGGSGTGVESERVAGSAAGAWSAAGAGSAAEAESRRAADPETILTARGAPQRGRPADPALVESLRTWRLGEARRRQVPAFCVMPNRSLEEIARVRPGSERELLAVRGVGQKIVVQYGAAILDRIRQAVADDNPGA